MNHKNDKAYKTIGEVAKILDLVNLKKGTLNTHTIRFWEKEFKQIKPKILNGNRRYYTQNDILTILKINDLISSEGFTIEGAKQKLLSKSNSPETEDHSLLLLKKDIEKIIDVLEK